MEVTAEMRHHKVEEMGPGLWRVYCPRATSWIRIKVMRQIRFCPRCGAGILRLVKCRQPLTS